MKRLWFLGLCWLLVACPTGDDEDATADDDDATTDDDDATGDDDDATDDDDSGDDDDSAADPESCAAWADDDLLDIVYNGPKVPPGYFVDSYPGNEFPSWGATCSLSLANTETAASVLYASGTLTGATRTEPEFYEVSVEINDGLHTVHYRETRCDYYDGVTLAGAPFAGYDELQWLAGYLWYAGNHNISGHHIVDGFGAVGDATNFFSLCYVTTVYGDWGLCDEITLWQSDSSILQSTGTVTPGTPAFLRMIQGNCN